MTKKETEKLIKLLGKAMSENFSYQNYDAISVEELTATLVFPENEKRGKPTEKIDIDNADHPKRKLAIYILENLIDEMGVDWKNDNWFKAEDCVVNALVKKGGKK